MPQSGACCRSATACAEQSRACRSLECAGRRANAADAASSRRRRSTGVLRDADRPAESSRSTRDTGRADGDELARRAIDKCAATVRVARNDGAARLLLGPDDWAMSAPIPVGCGVRRGRWGPVWRDGVDGAESEEALGRGSAANDSTSPGREHSGLVCPDPAVRRPARPTAAYSRQATARRGEPR